MQNYRYEIGYNDSINRWWISEVGREAYASPYETFDAEVNLGEAYVQIVYPVRREFLKEDRISKVKKYEGNYDRVYFPFENNRVDFTTFIHTPHYIYVNGKTQIEVAEDGSYPFELYTCGGMKIWVNGEEVVTFAPFTRNIPGKLLVELQLKAGINDIHVYADELAERDVFFYFEMRYKGDRPITGLIELNTDASAVNEIECFLKSVYVEKDCFKEGKIRLHLESSLLKEDINIRIEGDEEFTKLTNVRFGGDNQITISKGMNVIELLDVEAYNIGVFRIFVTSQLGEFHIRRELVVGVLHPELLNKTASDTIESRKEEALNFICEYGENVINRTLVILKQKKEMTPIAHQCMMVSLHKIEKLEDCADFYLPPMLHLMTEYRQYLSEEDYNRMKDSVLNFRYWIDEPGNDVMWYFSENHALLFHISQYLAGHLYGEDEFKVSGRLGKEQYQIGKKRLEDWFETFLSYGYAEWNSATYLPVDLIGFFVLYLMAPDQHIKDLVTKALDFTYKVIAYNSYAGIMCSSYGRAYEETLKGRELVEPNFLAWIAYKKGYLTSASRAASLFCLTDYVPPAYDLEVEVSDLETITMELDQGINKVKTYSYRTNNYFMACVRRFKPFVHGHQQHLMNVALGERGVQYFINHPGERPYSGGNRPAYWAGNGTIPYIEQYKNTMIMLYKIDAEELVHYIHGYTPTYEYNEYELHGKWFFAKVDDAYIATYFSNGVELVESGANTRKEIISYGLNHGVVVRCGSEKEFGDYENFKAKMLNIQVVYDGEESLYYVDPTHGEIRMNHPSEFLVNGQMIPYEEAAEYVIIKEDI